MSLYSRNYCAMRIQDAGGSTGLVQSVIAALEDGVSLYRRDQGSFDEKFFELLVPDLDVLIKMTEDLAALVKSGRDLCEVRLQEVQRVLSDCLAEMVVKKREVNDLTAKLADSEAKARITRGNVEDRQKEIDENYRKIAELEKQKSERAELFWVPGHNLYLFGRVLDDLCQQREPLLAGRLRDAVKERDTIEMELRALVDKYDSLTREKRGKEQRIRDLNDSKKVFEHNCKVYSHKFGVLSDVIDYYRLLRSKIKNAQMNLDLLEVISRLYESKELIQLSGEAHQVTMKEVLLQLGADYDRCLKHGDIEEGVSISFKLLFSGEPLPSGYRLATVREVTNHHDELFKVMPSWEIANLEDGSVSGKAYGGAVSLEVRKDVLHKLAVTNERDLDGHKGERNITFKLLSLDDPLPSGYHLATVPEVIEHRKELFKIMPDSEIANLANGSVSGKAYGYPISLEERNDVAYKLAVTTEPDLDREGGVSFKLLPLEDFIPFRYRLATVAEVTRHREELFKVMPNWEIANLANGSVSGKAYGGRISSQVRNDVVHKLVVTNVRHEDRYEGGVSMSFKLLSLEEPIPSEYRLATVAEVTKHREELFKVMPNWEIANLANGSVSGKAYGGRISSEVRNDVAYKLVVTNDHDHHWVNITFKLLSLEEPIPSRYRLATVAEVIEHPKELFKVMPDWEIANLANGSISGKAYGGRISSQVRNDVAYKLVVTNVWHDDRHERGVSTTFKLLSLEEPLPSGYHLATVAEVTKHREELLKVMPDWEIANLANGSVSGKAFGGVISSELRNDVAYKLAFANDHDRHWVSISFKLLSLEEPIPSGYHLATAAEVTRHREELFKVMPNWEIANLANGSVSGKAYGGRISSQVRNDVAYKLVVTNVWHEDRHEGGVSITFKLFSSEEPIPSGYHLATVAEVTKHREELLKVMPNWEIANLANGSVSGKAFGGVISSEVRKDVAYKLAVTNDHDRHWVSISFKLLSLEEPIPSGYHLATAAEVTKHREELFKVMPNWEIANLANGSVSGKAYGGRISSEVRNDVVYKLAVTYEHDHDWREDGLEIRKDVAHKLAITNVRDQDRYGSKGSIYFKLLPLEEPLPSGYRLARVAEVAQHLDELLKAMPNLEIANLANGSVSGKAFGGQISSKIRKDVAYKLAITNERDQDRHGGIVTITFKLLAMEEPLPFGYRLARVAEVAQHLDELLKAMPNLEIANLANGSVSGKAFGGQISSKIRKDVAYKLAITNERDQDHHGGIETITLKHLSMEEPLP